MLKVGSDFSGVGAFNQALMRLGVDYKEIFACDMDKYARQTFIQNYGEPEYFPENVYDREIPSESLDVYMTSPPCQAFSMAGKRLGKEDARGILFFNSHEFIQKNKPRFFIFENVKGLLSHDKTNKKDKIGSTFREWLDYLGGRSVNGVANMYPIEDALPYHIHWKVLNAKKHGVPQNRERVFIIGIRDDQDNTFVWPEEEDLSKKLKDVLEDAVDDKYFLSDKMINGFLSHNKRHIEEKGQDGFNWKPKDETQIANCLRANAALRPTDNTIKVKSATQKGYEEATIGDSINFSVPNSETRRGRVGKGVAQTLDTACNQATLHNERIRRLTPRECFRLMDFPDSFTWPVSNSQAYKQAGNSIVVNVLYKILKQLPL
jgi:DNA (cytosine-5)-methyltransferase 1